MSKREKLDSMFHAALSNQFKKEFGQPIMEEKLIDISASPFQQQGIKHDNEKPDMSLLSSIAIVKISEVMTFGKKKYSAHNWRGGIVFSRLLAASLRHLFAYLGGQDKDPETGLSHIAHLGCCIMMLLEFETTRKDLDDRYKEPNEKRS